MILLAIPAGIGLTKPQPQPLVLYPHIPLWRLVFDEIVAELSARFQSLLRR